MPLSWLKLKPTIKWQQLKWPEPLSKTSLKVISLILFIIGFILEYEDIKIIYKEKHKECIDNLEVAAELSGHMTNIAMIMVPDAAFLVCIFIALPVKTCGFGADPWSIAYNFVSGILCICAMVPITEIDKCGEDVLEVVKFCTLYSTIAGIVHIMNAVFCLMFLMSEERKIPIRRPQNSMTSLNDAE